MASMFNVLICGTPGTGKSTLVEKIKEDLQAHNFSFINLSKFALENDCTCGYDEKLQSHEIDEEELEDRLKPVLETNKYNVVESIEADLLPPSLFDLVFVCRTDNTILYDRLKSRDYGEVKISENVSAEIFQMILDAARHSFWQEPSIVTELRNDQIEDLDRNARLVVDRINQKLTNR